MEPRQVNQGFHENVCQIPTRRGGSTWVSKRGYQVRSVDLRQTTGSWVRQRVHVIKQLQAFYRRIDPGWRPDEGLQPNRVNFSPENDTLSRKRWYF